MVSTSNRPEPFDSAQDRLRRGVSVELIAVGTELLLGQLVDTNTAHIASTLASVGVDVYGTHAVGDNQRRIASAIGSALDRADGVVTTGGLGPTIDDLTKEAVCDALGVEAELHEASLRAMQERFARLGFEMRDNNRKQAVLPKGAIVLDNPNGSAPGFIAFRADGKFVASMPGVPREMKPMLAGQLVPWLREHFDLHAAIHTRVLHTIGIAESEIDHRIDDLFRTYENPKIAVLAHDYRCDVKIMAKAESEEEARRLIAPVEHEITQHLHGHIFGVDDQTLAGAIHALLQQTRRTVSVAESCTGGAVCAALTAVPGSSKSFAGGVVAYENAVKVTALGVREETLARAGAVSEETAVEMAQGIRSRFGTDYGIATTGIAGPTGGSPEKPVGLVWLAFAGPSGARAVKRQMPEGDRASIQSRATVASLGMLWRELAK
jgi:nicotinamide-nucleotide amidase